MRGVLLVTITFNAGSVASAAELLIVPLRDSVTRGTYVGRHDSGQRNGQAIGLPNLLGGGWRKSLRDR
jgi:hypothetical protein